MKRLSLEWFKGIPPEKKDGFEELIRNSTTALGQLVHIVDAWEQELDRAALSTEDYDSPSWAAKQAHRNGDRSRLRKLRDLLSFLN